MELSTPIDTINDWIESAEIEKNKISELLNGNEKGLYKQLESFKEEKEKLIATTNSEEKQYQKYLQDLSEWENTRKKIIGDVNIEGTLSFFESEKNILRKN